MARLASSASITRRLTLGCGVYLLALRPPAVAAQATATLDMLASADDCVERFARLHRAACNYSLLNPICEPEEEREQPNVDKRQTASASAARAGRSAAGAAARPASG